MKKISTISLFIFGVIVISIMTSGLVFYQNNKDRKVANSSLGTLAEDTIKQIESSGQSIVLDLSEISKHNKQTDCWMLINGKVYNVTSYFGSHPGGNSPMAKTCGTDATDAYMTQDPNATSSGSRSDHSSNAISLLAKYYIGELNQKIGKQTSSPNESTVNNINNNTDPSSNVIKVDNSKSQEVKPVIALGVNLTLSLSEISKHNKQTDCWMLINGKVYNVTSYFGSHPGGNSPMAKTCGTDATDAYMTQDPNATSSGSRSDHSSNAISLLAKYYIGDLNQTIGSNKVVETNSIISNSFSDDEDDDEEEDEDDD